MKLNPFRLLGDVLNEILSRTVGTYFGAPQDPPWGDDEREAVNEAMH